MDGRRPAEGVNVPRRSVEGAEADSALEREIEAALAVDPSPEFVAKVRARVADEPAPGSWWQLRGPLVATVAAAAAVVMAVALSWQPAAPEQSVARGGADIVLGAPAPQTAAPLVAGVQATAPGVQPSHVTVARAPSRTSRPVGRTLSGPPEVLISRDEQRGLELLLTAVRDGRLTPTLASQLVAGGATVEADIPISDIVIEPLPQIAALGGEEQ